MTLLEVLYDIMKHPSSFTLRERIAREPDMIMYILKFPYNSKEFLMGLKIVESLQKYNPSILTLH
jgi:hypothetical protein